MCPSLHVLLSRGKADTFGHEQGIGIMQIEYCESCKCKLTEVQFESGEAVWINNQSYCKDCGSKVPRKATSASRSGARAVSARATPGSQSRLTPGHGRRRLSTPSASPHKSGTSRAASGDAAKSSGAHPRRSSSNTRSIADPRERSSGPSTVMISVIGAAIGVLLAVLVIMFFFR